MAGMLLSVLGNELSQTWDRAGHSPLCPLGIPSALGVSIQLLSDIPPSLEHGTPRFQGHVAIVPSTWQDRSDPSTAAARAEVSERSASAAPHQLDLAHVV